VSRDDTLSLTEQIGRPSRRVRSLQMAVYAAADPAGDVDLFRQLAEEEAKLETLQREAKPSSEPPTDRARPLVETKDHQASLPPSRGRLLGPNTTGLSIEPTLQMQPVPTGIYHLLDPEKDPLVRVVVGNVSRDARRVCIKTFLEGLSALAVRTVEIPPRDSITLNLLPTLLPDKASAITEIQRATLHVIAEDLDGKPESHDTFHIVCLARTASFNAIRRPNTDELVDLSHYYGAWVTPYADAVQQRVREAAELMPQRQILGYQGDPDGVTEQVKAIYQSLRNAEIVYVNSVIDYGAPLGQATQRTRLPRESLAQRSANCIDGTVLMASLLEGSSLNPAIVLVPGHAFVGWEVWDGADDWRFLETTMISTADFEAACESGHRQYENHKKYAADRMKMHRLTDLRARGVWPME